MLSVFIDRKGKQSILGPDQSSLQCVQLLVFFVIQRALYVDYGVLCDFSNLPFHQCNVHCSLCIYTDEYIVFP